MTSYQQIFDSFEADITEDMYMELTQEETAALEKELLYKALPHFEFPKVNLDDYDDDAETFNIDLTNEEINIIATYMIVHWISQQLANIDVTRQKYSGTDFKFTSQANHMAKLKELKAEYERMGFHLQRLYKRREKDSNGIQRSTLHVLRTPSATGRSILDYYGSKR